MKEKFNQIIAETVKPHLKLNGFIKKGFSFYKRTGDLIQVINFQNSHGNTHNQIKFYINCGIHSNQIDRVLTKPELEFPKEYDCYFRSRISAIVNSSEDGYLISEETDINNLAKLICLELNEVIKNFEQISSTDHLLNLMIEKNGLSNPYELFEYLLLSNKYEETLRFVKLLYKNFGFQQRWKTFENNLNEIIIEHNKDVSIAKMLNK